MKWMVPIQRMYGDKAEVQLLFAGADADKGQEGAAPDAPNHNPLGALGVTGFLVKDTTANPLDYVEGGKWAGRRERLSQWLDSTDPDLLGFEKRGGNDCGERDQ
jgi:hypothetical protein